MRKYFQILLMALTLCSCGEYNRALKSKDVDYKFDYAKRAFEEGKFVQASSILTDVITPLKGGPKGEEALYLLGRATTKVRTTSIPEFILKHITIAIRKDNLQNWQDIIADMATILILLTLNWISLKL